MSRRSLALLANHGAIGGGEVMLLAMAVAARQLDVPVRVVAPLGSDVEHAAADLDLEVVGLDADVRGGYLRALTSWTARRQGSLLWGNGASAALATTPARDPTVVHLHQLPTRPQSAALRVARSRAVATVVPSASMQRAIPGSEVLLNWTAEPADDLDPVGPTVQRVGFIGRMLTRKGLDVLARACAQARDRHGLDLELVVAGDDRFAPPGESGPVAEALTELGASVRLLGWVDRRELYGQVDVVVVPSVWDEPFGLVAAEAMAHRRPVLVTRAGALPEIVGRHHPWIVPPGDAAALAAALVALRDDPEGRARSVDDGVARWRARFSPTAGAQRLAQLLGRLGVR